METRVSTQMHLSSAGSSGHRVRAYVVMDMNLSAVIHPLSPQIQERCDEPPDMPSPPKQTCEEALA
jgi:hypothetical protein